MPDRGNPLSPTLQELKKEILTKRPDPNQGKI
jgi:hypothetical protein